MIKIIPKKDKKTKREPFYKLKYYYMIGDANGNTSETVIISKDNPYLERYVTLLNSLKPTTGHWGIVLEQDRIKDCFEEGQITEDDYKFLLHLMFEYTEDEEDENKYFTEDDEYSLEFYDGVRGDTQYSFLVFEGLKLTYFDEYGTEYKTKIE